MEGAQLEAALTAGGFAWSPVVRGGRAVAYRVSRVWCEAWIPFVDFRGVVLDRGGSTWVALDPWMKDRGPWPGEAVLSRMGLDGAAFREAYLTGGGCGADLTEAGACPEPRAVLLDQVASFLESKGEAASVEELAAGRELEAPVEELLPSAMVGRVVQVDGFGLEVDEGLRYRVRFEGVAGAVELMDATVDMAQLSSGEAVVWYEPAAPGDEEVVEALGGYLWDVPPYLLNVTPAVWVGERELARGEAGIGMGRGYELRVTIQAPSGISVSWSNAVLAGVPVGLGISAGRQGYVPPDGEPASTIELLSQLAGSYLDGVAAFAREAAALDHLVVVDGLPSVVKVSPVMEPRGNAGQVTGLASLGIQADADLWDLGVAGRRQRRSDNEDEHDVRVQGPAEVTYRLVSAGCTAEVQETTLEVSYDPGDPVHQAFYPEQGVDDGVVSTDTDSAPEPDGEGSYHIAWDGRDDTSARRILIAGRYRVKVDTATLVITDTGAQTFSITNHHTQRIAKPHASNYGVNYGSSAQNFSLYAGVVASYVQRRMIDGSGYEAFQDGLASVSTVVDRLREQDAVFSFHGHSGPGVLLFQTSPTPSEKRYELLFADSASDHLCLADQRCAGAVEQAQAVSVLNDALGPGEPLVDVGLAVLMGCNTGVSLTGELGSVADVLHRAGVGLVVATPAPVNTSVGVQWEWIFWALVTGVVDPAYDPHLPEDLVWPTSLAEAARTAAKLALLRASNVSDEDKRIMKALILLEQPRDQSGIQLLLFPARYGR